MSAPPSDSARPGSVTDAGTRKSYARHHRNHHHQQQHQQPQAAAAALEPGATYEPAPAPTEPPELVYRDRPELVTEIQEGANQRFGCALEVPMKTSNLWTKDGMTLFNEDMTKADKRAAERFTFVGNLSAADYTIELRNASLDDAGVYVCQTFPPNYNPKRFDRYHVGTNLSVVPAPTITQSPSALASNMNNLVDSAGSQNSQRSSILIHVSPQSSLQSQSSQPTVNMIQPPSQPMMTRLPPSTRLFSARNTSGTGAASRSPMGLDAGLAMPILWPYLLLALAAILMLTNVYLIYSLVRRHTRSRPDLESPSGERKLSVHENSCSRGHKLTESK